MSNAVYPSFPGIRPVVARVPIAPPVDVRTTPSQREYRARDATLPRYRYSVSYEVLRSSAAYPELQALVGFFNARGGRFDSFLFDDEDDNTITDQVFGIGDGSTTAWQAVRSFGGFVEPVDAFNGHPLVLVNSAPATNQLPNSQFDLDTDSNGIADNWPTYSAGSAGTVTRAQVAGYSSANATRVSASALGSTGADRAGTNSAVRFAVSVGASYTVSARLRDSNNCVPVLRISWYDAASAFLSGSDSSFASSGATWTLRTATFVAPAGAVAAQVFVWVQAATGGPVAAWLELDRIKAEASAVATNHSIHLAAVADGSGVITFREPPGVGEVLSVSGKFYRRVRFERDELDVERFLQELWESRRVELRSTREG